MATKEENVAKVLKMKQERDAALGKEVAPDFLEEDLKAVRELFESDGDDTEED